MGWMEDLMEAAKKALKDRWDWASYQTGFDNARDGQFADPVQYRVNDSYRRGFDDGKASRSRK